MLFAKQTFALIDNKIKFIIKKKDGSRVKKGNLVALIRGKAKNILIAERVALNFLSHISGIATKTNEFVKLAGKKTKICCTRKTIPNLRVIQKYAVKLGGGTNHRFNLSDEYLIKDNHIASSDLKSLVLKAIKNKKGKKITDRLSKFENFKWLGRLEYPDKIREFLETIDVYALITGMDLAPLTLKEAQLMEKPVIATDVGGDKEMMVDGKTGFLVKEGSSNDIIEKLTRLLEDKQMSENMGKEGAKFVKEKFNWEIVAKNFLDIIKPYLKK